MFFFDKQAIDVSGHKIVRFQKFVIFLILFSVVECVFTIVAFAELGGLFNLITSVVHLFFLFFGFYGTYRRNSNYILGYLIASFFFLVAFYVSLVYLIVLLGEFVGVVGDNCKSFGDCPAYANTVISVILMGFVSFFDIVQLIFAAGIFGSLMDLSRSDDNNLNTPSEGLLHDTYTPPPIVAPVSYTEHDSL